MSSIVNLVFSIPTNLFGSSRTTNNDGTTQSTAEPITGICLVSAVSNVPLGYERIAKAHDDSNVDVNFVSGVSSERKGNSFCITRSIFTRNEETPIVEDLILINEADSVAESFVPLARTIDSNEKAQTTRLICAKIVERQTGISCINDIIFLSRTKTPPQFYRSIGQLNGLEMCVRTGTVPPFVSRTISVSSYEQRQHNASTRSSDEKDFLDGIPFQINPKLVFNQKNIENLSCFPFLKIDKDFHYEFHVEHSVLSEFE